MLKNANNPCAIIQVGASANTASQQCNVQSGSDQRSLQVTAIGDCIVVRANGLVACTLPLCRLSQRCS